MNIFIAGLSYQISETDLRELFEEYGEVSSARIITDRDTQRSKGYGFVEMNDDADTTCHRRIEWSQRRTYPLRFDCPPTCRKKPKQSHYGNRDYHERNRY